MNWQKCDKITKRLQAHIVLATKEKRWNKVKALKHFLTHSISAKALAVKQVTTNRGNCTAGIDGQLWKTSALKSDAISNLRQKGYNLLPLKRIYIPLVTLDYHQQPRLLLEKSKCVYYLSFIYFWKF